VKVLKVAPVKILISMDKLHTSLEKPGVWCRFAHSRLGSSPVTTWAGLLA